jgi:chromosome segregation ATPase
MQAAQSNLESLRQRRDEAAQLASEVRANVATLEERRRGAMLTVQRIEAMLSEVSDHLAKLKSQLDAAIAEKQQRESENVRLAEQVIEWSAERDVAQQRDRELQDELQAVRVRIVELEDALKSPAKRSTPPATAVANSPPRRPGCNRMPSTWLKPVSRS